MPIDIRSDDLLSMAEASRVLPGRPAVSTLHRWRIRGIRGIRLETCLIGGIRYTSWRAIQEFVSATSGETVAARSEAVAKLPRNPLKGTARRRSKSQASKTLDAAGFPRKSR